MTSKNERNEGMGPKQREAQEKMAEIRRMKSVRRRPGESRASHARRIEAAANADNRAAKDTEPSDEVIAEHVAQHMEHQAGLREDPPDDIVNSTDGDPPRSDEQLAAEVATRVERTMGITAEGGESDDSPSDSGGSDSADPDNSANELDTERQFGAPDDEGGEGDDDDEGPPDDAA